jgi:membrane protease YdiL (CAAX protease family)
MSEPFAVRPEWTAPAPPSSFSTVVTVVCSIAVVLYVGLLGRPLVDFQSSPLLELERPADSLDRFVTRDLELRAAMRRGVAWEWRLYRALSGDEDPLEEAGAWYDELVETVDAPAGEFHRAIILAESGRAAEAGEAVAGWSSGGMPDERMASWVAAAYLAPPPTPEAGRAAIEAIDAELPESWFSDTLVARIAGRIGDRAARARAEDAIAARGRALLPPARALMGASLLLVLGGAGAGVWLLGRGARPEVARAPLPPPWTGRDGYALFVRGLGAPQAIALVAFVALRRDTGVGTLFGMAADLPLFWWVARYCWRRHQSVSETFGLWPRRDGWAPLLGVTALLIGAALVSDTAIQVASGYLPIRTHWADGFAEELLWASPRRLLVETAAAAIWAPIVEEITFRGLLYGALRTRFGVEFSALASAVVFVLPHGYGLTGSLSVLVSGILWALAYERTRSLWPGLLAHSANNLLSTLWITTLLR